MGDPVQPGADGPAPSSPRPQHRSPPPPPDDPLDTGGWGRRAAVITELMAAQGRLVQVTGERDLAMRARDSAMRTARDAGWTYDDIIARIGVSSTTITNAVRRG